jgi:Flp pilus assembly protein TadG
VFRRFKKENKGQSLVEFALVVPIILILCLGTIQFGYMLNTYIVLSGLARDAVRVGSVTNSDAKINEVISQNNPTLIEEDIKITITPEQSNRKRGDQLTVRLDYPLPLIVPMFDDTLGDNILTSAITMRVE